MGRDGNHVDAGGEGAIGAGRDVHAATTGDNSPVTYVGRQYVRQTVAAPESSPPSADQVDAALRRYAVRVRECYGRLDLDVLIPTEEGEHPPVGLNEVFVPPSVRADPPPLELPQDLRRRLVDSGDWPVGLPSGLGRDAREALERARQAYAERPASDVLDVLADPEADRVVLLGDPGAGKSTLARHLALVLTEAEGVEAGGVEAGGDEPDDPLRSLADRVPLVVELREYAAGPWWDLTFEDFLKYLHSTKGMAPPPSVTERLLAEGRAVVVFDGLDELFDPAARQQVGHRIADFAGRHRDAGVRVVVTSRVIGYQRGVLESAGFRHFMIQDLDEDRIDEFAWRWYATSCPHDEDRAERLYERLMDAVTRSRPVRELAGNPLLLTILAIIGRRRELPRDRQGVYRHAVAVLIAHWDEHAKNLRAPEDVEALSYLGDEDRHELLRLVARRMQDGEDGIAGNHIHQDVLLATFKDYLREQYELPVAQAVSAARTMVRQFRERNFILSHYGGGVYGFVHRAFLEYLAAEDIDRRYTRYREWTPEEFIERIFVRHAHDPAWHEVLLLLVGQVGEPEAAAAIDRLLVMHRRRNIVTEARLLVLAARALAEVRRIGAVGAQSRGVVDSVIRSFENVDGWWTLLHDKEDIAFVLSTFPERWSGRARFLRWFHVRGQFGMSTDMSGLVACGLYPGQACLVMAVHAPSSAVRVWMLRVLADDCDPEDAEHIADTGIDFPALLRDRAAADPDEEVRETALRLLTEYDDVDGAVEVLLRERSVADPEVRIRALALFLLREYESVGSDAWAPISAMAESALSAADRGAAVQALADYRDDERTWALLRRLAAEDPSKQVRYDALICIERARGNEAETRALRRNRAAKDPDVVVRRLALRLLSDRQDRWPPIRLLAVEDEDPRIREAAVEGLSELWPDEADTWELLRRIAVADPDPAVRGEACVQLGRRADEQPDAWEFLRGRVIEESDGDARGSAFRGLLMLSGQKADIWDFLRGRSVDDPDDGVRATALSELCEHRSDEAETWHLALARLTSDPHPRVRKELLTSLRHYNRDESDLWPRVHERATADPDASVRAAALRLLATADGDAPTTRELIRDRTTADPDPGIRADALRWWAVYEKGDPGAELLRDRATTDPDPTVRTAALQSLAHGWPAHPATLPLLRERIETDEAVRDEVTRALAAAEALAPIADRLP
ncbi:HEAT repeat domain-containing protein [Streptomyces sp. DSM 40750]|uniref:HEAT repeat domain-containing protein n=1 Tax=Streptomyces sp. DSM 40750 TaxID=2801030 RepID=UPI00214B6C30|nr:HEAT repeat domain-containing protein [Streptomyces sp. DSM 40750]UUU24241.1 HEAT repeat domain-containing protein [Streptomyces sp. DSM 40750]